MGLAFTCNSLIFTSFLCIPSHVFLECVFTARLHYYLFRCIFSLRVVTLSATSSHASSLHRRRTASSQHRRIVVASPASLQHRRLHRRVVALTSSNLSARISVSAAKYLCVCFVPGKRIPILLSLVCVSDAMPSKRWNKTGHDRKLVNCVVVAVPA